MTDIIREADRLIKSSIDEEVTKFGDGAALAERIREWLTTPVGTVADKPGWGHALSSFKFDPTNLSLDVAIEIAIAKKIQIDIRDLVFVGVRADFMEIDLCKIVIRHQFGDSVSLLKL